MSSFVCMCRCAQAREKHAGHKNSSVAQPNFDSASPWITKDEKQSAQTSVTSDASAVCAAPYASHHPCQQNRKEIFRNRSKSFWDHTRWSNERTHPDLDQRVYFSKWQYRLKKEIMKRQLASHGSLWISSWTRLNRQMILGSLNLIRRYKCIVPVSCSTHRTAEEGSHERVANLGGLHGEDSASKVILFPTISESDNRFHVLQNLSITNYWPQ